ncbi:MAG TPA: phosphotransferase [Bacillales bacterium]|nr:phosphotransferase [Bacillales bacterium]
MKLSTMKKVVDTLDHEGRSSLGDHILERWGYDKDSVQYLRASANFVFVFHKNNRAYFLRFNDACERDLAMIEAEIEILHYLKDKPLRTAQPVKSLNNRFVEEVHTDLGTFYAVVFAGLPGKQYELEDLNEKEFFLWGKALGRLHHVLKSIPQQYGEKRPSWKAHLDFVKETLPEEETAAQKELEKINQWGGGQGVFTKSFGLIHYDFELDNLIWDQDQVGILDFDDTACYGYAADIAYALRELFEDGIDLENPHFQKFMEGYRKETPLDETILHDLPWFMRLHNLVSFAKLLRSVDVPETQSGSLSNLRTKLTNLIENYRASF